MFDAIKADNGRYAAFAASMVEATKKEEAEIARINETRDDAWVAEHNAATIAPKRG